jgi:hypothetical protein
MRLRTPHARRPPRHPGCSLTFASAAVLAILPLVIWLAVWR